MGFFDRLKERNRPQEAETVTQSFEGTDFQAANSDQAQDLSNKEDITGFASGAAIPEGRLYNPYEGLSSAVDPRVLRSVYKLPNQPEFLFSEEATVHKRSISENLSYYTGVGYLTGKLAYWMSTLPQQKWAWVWALTCGLNPWKRATIALIAQE